MKQRNLKYIGITLIVGGIMLFFDGLGSLILPGCMHGVFIVLGGSLWCLWSGASWEMGWMGTMMNGWDEHMNGWSTESATYMMGILGIVFGVIVVVSAVMLYTNPVQHELWGALIIVFSVTSVLSCMGGMGIGLILGVIGGILAILWKPVKTKQM